MIACIEATDVFDRVRIKATGYALLGSRKIGGGRSEYIFAHRRVYEESFGPIPEGMHIHHTCENRTCVNPAHLIALTPKQHKQVHRRSHCRRGHEMSPANTLPKGGCRQCKRDAERVRVVSPESKARKAEKDRLRYAKPEVRERKAALDRIRYLKNKEARILAGGDIPKL